MALIDALLICGAVLVATALLVWEAVFQPRFLKSWLVWSATMGVLGFVALVHSGRSLPESLAFFVFTPILVAVGQLRHRLRERIWKADAAREARYDAWGNPRPTAEASKWDGSEGDRRTGTTSRSPQL